MRRVRFAGWLTVVLAAFTLHTAHAKTLHYAYRIDANSLDPQALAETFTLAMLGNIYEPLVGRGKHLEIVPALATAWEVVNPTTWRFTLRQGVTFQDGSKFTADDVLFSLARAAKPGSDVGYMAAAVSEVIKVDDFTVEIVTKTPDPILPQQITSLYIMSRAWAEKNNAASPSSVKGNVQNYATTHANGTGPFAIQSRQQDVKTVLVPNPTWWEKPEHNLTEVDFTPVASDATRVAGLLSGELDMIYPVPLQDVNQVNASGVATVIQGPELRVLFLEMDQSRDQLLESDVKGKNPLKDLRVRQALYEAIDIETIHTKVMRGASTPVGLIVAPGLGGYDKSLDVRLPYDPAAAKKLLAEAGYPNGFELGMDCSNDRYVNDEAICQAIVGMLGRIGVKVKLLAQTRTKFFEKVLSHNTSFAMLAWQPLTYDAHDTLLVHVHTPTGQSGTYNVGSYSNKEMDDLIEAAGSEVDPAKRQALISAALKKVRDDVVDIPLHQQALAWGVRKNVHVVQLPDDSFYLRWVTID